MPSDLIERYLSDMGEIRGTSSNVPDLDLTAGWGHAGKGGVTMPGKGKTAVHGGSRSTATADGVPPSPSLRRPGEAVPPTECSALDIFLNDIACWRNIPAAVWDYTIGGYQVIKKWLSYREKPLLGRSLTPDEVRYVTEMARRLSALIALQPALDTNYREVSQTTYSWPEQ